MANSANLFLVVGLTCLVSYLLFCEISLFLRRRSFSARYGCKPASRLPQSDRIIGFQLLKEQMQNAKSFKLLEGMRNRSLKYGNTYTATMMGQKYIVTNEPENLKAVLATNFRDFGIRGRKQSFGPLLGNGIFTSDGAQWEHSRVSILLETKMKPLNIVLGTDSSEFRQGTSLQF
jgi:hypothetical protein